MKQCVPARAVMAWAAMAAATALAAVSMPAAAQALPAAGTAMPSATQSSVRPLQAGGNRQQPHQHGLAHMTVAQDGAVLVIEFMSPLDNLVGFERAPRSERERELVLDMARKLRSGKLLLPLPAAQCRAVSVELMSSVLEPALLAEGGPAAAPARPPGASRDHAELLARLEFSCARPQALKSIDVQLAAVFRKLERIDVQLATPSGQARRTLSHNARSLNW